MKFFHSLIPGPFSDPRASKNTDCLVPSLVPKTRKAGIYSSAYTDFILRIYDVLEQGIFLHLEGLLISGSPDPTEHISTQLLLWVPCS